MWCFRLQYKIESGALANRGLSPDSSPVFANNALHSGQANSSPRIISICMEPLKDTEKFVGVLHVKACTVVADIKNALRIPIRDADLNMRSRALGCKFPCIPQQVL